MKQKRDEILVQGPLRKDIRKTRNKKKELAYLDQSPVVTRKRCIEKAVPIGTCQGRVDAPIVFLYREC